MAKEFQPYGATYSELQKKSGLKRTAYQRALNFARDRKWLVGGGKQGAPYYLNPDGCWRAAMDASRLSVNCGGDSVAPVRPSMHPETGPSGSGSGAVEIKIDAIVALTSNAILHVDKG
jgi:hypothetical protein